MQSGIKRKGAGISGALGRELKKSKLEAQVDAEARFVSGQDGDDAGFISLSIPLSDDESGKEDDEEDGSEVDSSDLGDSDDSAQREGTGDDDEDDDDDDDALLVENLLGTRPSRS